MGAIAPTAESSLIAPKSVCKNVPGNTKITAARRSMLCFTNYARARKGLKRYRTDSKLNASSFRKAQDIIRCGQFSHTACGRDFSYWMGRLGYPACYLGENIAWGSGSLGSSRSIFIAWMKSAGHRGAILDRDYREIGISVRTGQLRSVGKARVWVQNFGGPC